MATKTTPVQKSLAKPLAWILLVGGIIGLIASAVLTYDKLEILKNPHFVPNCNLDPVLSCGSVMVTDQANAFGFPNPWIGLGAFAVIITVAMALFAGAKFKRWFWVGLEIGMTLGLIFALWLLQQSIYSINALCPYCLAVDVAVITMIWYTTLYLIETKMLVLPKSWAKVTAFARRHHLDILVFVFVVIIAVILNHFWYYYGTKL